MSKLDCKYSDARRYDAEKGNTCLFSGSSFLKTQSATRNVSHLFPKFYLKPELRGLSQTCFLLFSFNTRITSMLPAAVAKKVLLQLTECPH